jgi:hypothetical protein
MLHYLKYFYTTTNNFPHHCNVIIIPTARNCDQEGKEPPVPVEENGRGLKQVSLLCEETKNGSLLLGI